MPTLKKQRTKYFKEGLKYGLPYYLAQKYARVKMGELSGHKFVELAVQCGFECVGCVESYERDFEPVYVYHYRSSKCTFLYETFFGDVYKFYRLK